MTARLPPETAATLTKLVESVLFSAAGAAAGSAATGADATGFAAGFAAGGAAGAGTVTPPLLPAATPAGSGRRAVSNVGVLSTVIGRFCRTPVPISAWPINE